MSVRKSPDGAVHCEACGRGASYSSLELFEWARRVERAKLEKELNMLRATVKFLNTLQSATRVDGTARSVRPAMAVAATPSAAQTERVAS